MRMVKEWGLSPLLGPIGYGSDDPGYSSGPTLGVERPYAEGTQQVIDQEVTRLLTEAEETAHSLLSEHRDALDDVIAALLEKETISGEELVEIVGPRQPAAKGTKRPIESIGHPWLDDTAQSVVPMALPGSPEKTNSKET